MDAGACEIAADGGSALLDEEPSMWRRVTNLAQYGNEDGYHMGPCHWQPLVDHTDGELVVEKASQINGAVSVQQHGPFRALRFGDSLQSVTITEDSEGRQVASARQVAFGYVRAMATAAASFSRRRYSGSGKQLSPFKNGTLVCLGVGGGALPALLSLSFPEAHIQAVDIDPVVIQIATEYMSLSAPDLAAAGGYNLSVQRLDARQCIRSLIDQDIKSPAIFLDCYNKYGNVPPYLTGAAFIASCIAALAPDGLLIANCFNNEVGSEARTRFAAFACHMQAEVGPGNVYSIKAVNQEVNVILVAVKRSATERHPLRRQDLLQTASQGGADAGFMFDASAELQDLFMVHAEDVKSFHETPL